VPLAFSLRVGSICGTDDTGFHKVMHSIMR
jgi:hypothetical protein